MQKRRKAAAISTHTMKGWGKGDRGIFFVTPSVEDSWKVATKKDGPKGKGRKEDSTEGGS